MRHKIIVILVLLCCACTFQAMPLMTIDTFTEVDIGISESELVKEFGQPIKKYSEAHRVIYEYVERFQMGNTPQSVIESRRYLFFIENGFVVSKRMEIRNPSPASDEESLNQ